MEPIEFNEPKFRELLLYVAEKCADDPKFGATKLNKILFFSDFMAYGLFGKSITGATYQRLDYGPAPKQLLPAQQAMRNAGEAAVALKRLGMRVQKRLTALRESNLSAFNGREIALVDHVIEQLRNRNATEVSLLSHVASIGWQVAADHEAIPYSTVFLSCEPPTAEDVRRGQELAAKHGWNSDQDAARAQA